MKLELIRISYTNTPSTQLIYKVEVLITFNLFEMIVQPKRVRKITFTGDVGYWWYSDPLKTVLNRKVTRFLNKVAMEEERSKKDARNVRSNKTN